MEIKSVIIDTNAYAEFKKGNPDAIEIIRKSGNIIFSPVVIGELIAGFKIGTRENKNKKELNQFIDSKRVICIYIDNSTSEEYGNILKELRLKGKPIPTNDIWIAATAKQYDLPIFSYDKHFKLIDGIKLINTSSNM